MAGRAEAGALRAAAADDALACLTQLTFLSLMTLESQGQEPVLLPPALSALGRLHTACLLVGPAEVAAALPAGGAYRASLRRLVLNLPSAAASLEDLSAAPRLKELSILSFRDAVEMEGYQVGGRVAGGPQACGKPAVLAAACALSCKWQPLRASASEPPCARPLAPPARAGAGQVAPAGRGPGTRLARSARAPGGVGRRPARPEAGPEARRRRRALQDSS